MTPERLSKPTAGIDAFGRATISRADLAATETLRAALGEARAFVATYLRSTLECDPEDVEHVAHIKGVLARIDAVLEGK